MVSRRRSACSMLIWLRSDVLISFRISTHSFAKTVAVCASRASNAFVHLFRRVWSRDGITRPDPSEQVHESVGSTGRTDGDSFRKRVRRNPETYQNITTKPDKHRTGTSTP